MNVQIENVNADKKKMTKEKLNEKLKDIVLVEHSNEYYNSDDGVRTFCMKTARQLLEEGADPNYRVARNFFKSDVLLHITNQVPMAELLLTFGANPDAKGDMKDTPLHRAIEKRKGVGMVKLLLENGASVDSYNKLYHTPLYTALLTSQRAVATVLQDHGADLYKCVRMSALEYNKAMEGTPRICKLAGGELRFNRFWRKHLYESTFGVAACQNIQTKHVQECLAELRKMEMVVSRCEAIPLLIFLQDKAARRKCVMMPFTKKLTSSFPIYKDMIEEAVQKIIKERSELLKKMQNVKVFNYSENKCNVLDFDSVCDIAKFLTYEEINNLYLAFVDLSPEEVQMSLNIEKQCDSVEH